MAGRGEPAVVGRGGEPRAARRFCFVFGFWGLGGSRKDDGMFLECKGEGVQLEIRGGALEEGVCFCFAGGQRNRRLIIGGYWRRMVGILYLYSH